LVPFREEYQDPSLLIFVNQVLIFTRTVSFRVQGPVDIRKRRQMIKEERGYVV